MSQKFTPSMRSCGFMCFEDTNVEWPDTFSGVCQYGPGPVAKKGFLLQYSFRGGCRREQVSHGKCFYGTEGSLLLSRSGYTISSEARPGKKLGAEIESAQNAFTKDMHVSSLANHAQVFLDCMRTRERSPTDVEVGHHATNPGHLMNIAWKTGRKIRWDAENEKVIDDDEANALVTKAYRAPWKLEV